MGSVNLAKLWIDLAERQDLLALPEVLSHEESDLHRVFCDEHFCLERGAAEE